MTLKTIREIREHLRIVRHDLHKVNYMLEYKFEHDTELNESLLDCHRYFTEIAVNLAKLETSLVTTYGHMMKKELTVV